MSVDEIKVVPELCEAMINTFKKASDQMDTTIAEIKTIVSILQNGALLGKAGDSYCEVLTTKLDPALLRLQAKFIELSADVKTAYNLVSGDAEDEVVAKL